MRASPVGGSGEVVGGVTPRQPFGAMGNSRVAQLGGWGGGGAPPRGAALETIRVTGVVVDPGEWWTRQVIHLPPGSREIRVHGSKALKTELRKVSSAVVAVVPPERDSVVSDVELRFPHIAPCRMPAGGGAARAEEQLARAVVRARRTSPAGRVMLDPGWPDEVPWAAWRFLTLCLSEDVDGSDITGFARRLEVSLRTLERDCQEGGLQTPRRILALARAVRMAWMLQAPGHTLDTVGVGAGLSGGVVAGRILRREGFSVDAVRAPGGLDRVRRHVVSALFRQRPGGEGNGRPAASDVALPTE